MQCISMAEKVVDTKFHDVPNFGTNCNKVAVTMVKVAPDKRKSFYLVKKSYKNSSQNLGNNNKIEKSESTKKNH